MWNKSFSTWILISLALIEIQFIIIRKTLTICLEVVIYIYMIFLNLLGFTKMFFRHITLVNKIVLLKCYCLHSMENILERNSLQEKIRKKVILDSIYRFKIKLPKVSTEFQFWYSTSYFYSSCVNKLRNFYLNPKNKEMSSRYLRYRDNNVDDFTFVLRNKNSF